MTMGKYITQEDLDEWSPDLVDFSQRNAKEVIEPQIQTMQQKLDAVANELFKTKRENLNSQLDRALPGPPSWREVNQSSEFLAWLETKDQYSGMRKIDLLRSGYDANDYSRVYSIFSDYMGGRQRRQANQQLPVQRSPDGFAYRSSTPARGRTYTRSQVAKAYDDLNRGRWKGREAEWQALERDIIAAATENRIING
jgi:hypothetical protein